MSKQKTSCGEFTLASSIQISLTSLKQSSTYSGMLEGSPTSAGNARMVARLVEGLTKKDGHAPYLIPPIETAVEKELPPNWPPWIELPRIECIAYFTSRSIGEFGSSLFVCWFQDDYAFPIDPRVNEQLLNIDWAKFARPHDDF